MTRHTVIWIPSAEKELTEIWLMSSLRDRVSEAVYAIDSALAQDAEMVGYPLTEGLFAFDEPPLRVLFEILAKDCIVRVLTVKEVLQT